jgi:DNA-binding NarL/FixJ family response regulator
MLEHYRKEFTSLGFRDVTVTTADKEPLNRLIGELKPRLLIIGANFHLCSTAYMMGLLLEKFPYLNIAAIAMSDYPADYMADFIESGVNSSICYLDGIEQFYEGLDCIRDGKSFISESVLKRIALRDEMSKGTLRLEPQQKEITKLTCNGLTGDEIGFFLDISHRTVKNQKTKIFAVFHVRNEKELIGVAIHLKVVDPKDLYFRAHDFVWTPEKEKRKNKGKFSRNIHLVKSETNTKVNKNIG